MKKLVLGVVLVQLLGLAAIAAARQAPDPAHYSWEECAEGWTVAETSDRPTGPWTRQPPGADGTEISFQITPYPSGSEPNASENYESTLTSLPHTSTGGEVTLSAFVAHDLELDLDFLYVEWSSDGTVWNELAALTGPAPPAEEEWKFTPPSGTFLVRFRLFSDPLISGNAGAGFVLVDEVGLTAPKPAGAACGAASPSPSGSVDPSASPSPTPTSSPSPSGCTITGTRKGETLEGTPGDDRICGKGGKDKLIGKGGDDLLNGGTGRDVCKGGPGKDTLKKCEKKKP